MALETPDLQSEVNRKILDAITKVYADWTNGKVSEAQAKYALDVIWSASAGLVTGKDYMTIMEKFDEQFSYRDKKIGIDQSYRHVEFNLAKDADGLTVRLVVTNPERTALQHIVVKGKPSLLVNHTFEEESIPSKACMDTVAELRHYVSK